MKKHLRHGAFFGLLVTAVAGVGLYVAQIGRTEEGATPVVLPPETNNIVTAAGTDRLIGDGGPATAAVLDLPLGLALDSSGNLYIGDVGGRRVRRVSPTGIITTVAGTGVAGFSGDGGPATAAQLNGPEGIALDPSGNLYIGDVNNQRVRKVDTNGIITTIVGTGVAGFSGDGGPATAAQINGPVGLALDPSGNLYIGDVNNHRVRKVDLATGIITTIAGTGVVGSSGDSGLATAARLNTPVDVSIDSAGNLYIAEYFGQRVRKVDLATGIITTVAGTGIAGFTGDGGLATSARLRAPSSLTTDSAGNLYITTTAKNVRKVKKATGIITTVAGEAFPGTVTVPFGGDGGPATAAKLHHPDGIALDSSGNLYIADSGNRRVRKVSPGGNGIIDGLVMPGGSGCTSPTTESVTIAGVAKCRESNETMTTFAGGGTIPSGDGGPATAAQLLGAADSVVDSSGNLYITEFDSSRVRKVSPTGIITTVAGTGIPGFSGDGGPATSAQLDTPSGLALDSSGNLYISDYFNDSVRKVDFTTGNMTTVAGIGTSGFSGDGGPATAAGLYLPDGLVFDSSGNLYITELGNQRVRKVDTNGIITTVAGTGTAGFNGDNQQATTAQLNSAHDVAFDSSGNLYIADLGNHRVRKIDAATGIITTVAGNGVEGFSGDGGPATAAQLRSPLTVAFDSSGNLYIGEGSSRIRKVDMATGIITTVAGTGVAGFSGDGGLATAAQFINPHFLTFDPSGNVYVADPGNDRIRRLNVAAGLNVDPDTLSITSSNGKWVTAYVQLPAGRDAADIDVNSVMLQAIDPRNGALRHGNNQVIQVGRASGSPKGLIDTNEDNIADQLMLKFDRATVASWATGAPELVLRVEGKFASGRYFSGDTQIRNIYPSMSGGAPSSPHPFEEEACDPELDSECEVAP